MKKKNIQEIGKRVIELEALALSKQATNIPKDFSRTIEAVLKTKGRVIVCGVGKSGHVGRKLAATLATQIGDQESQTITGVSIMLTHILVMESGMILEMDIQM